MTLEQYLISIWVNISASAIYDILKNYISKNNSVNISELKNKISSQLNIINADIKSENIIKFLAQNWDIEISWSNIYAENSVTIWSNLWTSFSFWNNSSSSTSKSSIQAWIWAYIQWNWGAKIVQHEDWSIWFYV